MTNGMRLFIAVLAIVLMIVFGGMLATYVLSGVLIFAGLVALVESIGILKWIFMRSSSILDLAIFGFSVYAMSSMGVTVSIGLSVAGLLFTVIYKPIFLSRNRVTKKHTL